MIMTMFGGYLMRSFTGRCRIKHTAKIRCMSSTKEVKHPSAADHDMIGPSNVISNLRPIVFHVPKDESPIEKKFRLKREEVQKWNESFWCNHNTKFFEQKEKFVAEHRHRNSSECSPISSDEMSVFYKKFLDENWKTHQLYNVEWYRRNITLLVLAVQVTVMKLFKKFKLNSTYK